jgi:tetrahydromethanopterin S-methyltransferase subunit G
MKVLNEALAVEQANVQEVRKQIDEFKARISAQNQEISKRITGKQHEAQVVFFFKFQYTILHNPN